MIRRMKRLLGGLVVMLAGMPILAPAEDVPPVAATRVGIADTVSVEHRERWERAGGQAALERALGAELVRSGWVRPTTTARLAVTVTGYRMRPGTAPPWLVYGAIPPYRVDHLADGDAIDLAVTVRDGDRVVDAYTVTAHVPDSPGPRDVGTRATRLAAAAARRIAATLAARAPRRSSHQS